MAVMSHRKRGLGRDLEGLLGQTTKRPMPGVAPTCCSRALISRVMTRA